MQPSPTNAYERLLADEAARNWEKYWEEVTAVVPSPLPTRSLQKLKRFLRGAGGLELGYRLVRNELGNSRCLCDVSERRLFSWPCRPVYTETHDKHEI